MSRASYRVKSGAAFTLVELLVVVAIIALLLSILLPSLANAREQSKKTKCLANMKDIVGGSITYANTDLSALLVPVGSTMRNTDYFSAARRGFGGKSGLHKTTHLRAKIEGGANYQDVNTWYGDSVGMWSTKNGFGPMKRPLNRYLFKSLTGNQTYSSLASLPLEEARKDEKLPYNVFQCPSDVGYEAGKDGVGTSGNNAGDVIFGYGTSTNRTYQDVTSTYDLMGTSYACDSVFTTAFWTYGVWFRRYEAISDPARIVTYLENKGFYGAFWNNYLNGQRNLNGYGWGWHGTLREHNVAFSDGHVNPVLFELRTNVSGTNNQNGKYNYSSTYELRGGDSRDIDWNDGGDADSGPWNSMAHLLKSGENWQNHCQPSPPINSQHLLWDNANTPPD